MTDQSSPPKRILVVDDEPGVRSSIRMVLKQGGYVVDEAPGGNEALAMFEPGKYNVILMDYSMPEMKGDEFAAAIRRISSTQSIVMITGFPEKVKSSGYPLADVDSIICKPFDVDTLLWAI